MRSGTTDHDVPVVDETDLRSIGLVMLFIRTVAGNDFRLQITAVIQLRSPQVQAVTTEAETCLALKTAVWVGA